MVEARKYAESRNAAMKERIDAGLFEDVTVQTKYGSLTGFLFNKSTQFLGVPFATPPVGDLRW